MVQTSAENDGDSTPSPDVRQDSDKNQETPKKKRDKSEKHKRRHEKDGDEKRRRKSKDGDEGRRKRRKRAMDDTAEIDPGLHRTQYESDNNDDAFAETTKPTPGKKGSKKVQEDPAKRLEECAATLQLMSEAYEHDKVLMNRGATAIVKLQALEAVVNAGRKSFAWAARQAIAESSNEGISVEAEDAPKKALDFLRNVKRWLETNPDGTLPSVQIRTDLLKLLVDFPCTKEMLKKSHVGHEVMKLMRQDDIKTNKDLCARIVQKWSKLIFQGDDDHVPERPTTFAVTPQERPKPVRMPRRTEDPLDSVETHQEVDTRWHPVIPPQSSFLYTKAPADRVGKR